MINCRVEMTHQNLSGGGVIIFETSVKDSTLEEVEAQYIQDGWEITSRGDDFFTAKGQGGFFNQTHTFSNKVKVEAEEASLRG